jgi:hypothetical protein
MMDDAGSAFFALQSCINHSCIPNTKAFKRDQVLDMMVQ